MFVMFEVFQKWLDRTESRISLASFIWMGSGMITLGGIGAYVGILTSWINAYGAFGWLCSALFLMFSSALLVLLIAHVRLKWNTASATRKWQEEVSYINPLETEFSKKRINIQDLAHPITNKISDKKFTNCQLIGPANIIFSGGQGMMYNTEFINCELVVMKDRIPNLQYENFVFLDKCSIVGGEVINCVLFIPLAKLNDFKNMGLKPLSFEKPDT